MNPVAIVIFFVGVLNIVGRGPHVVAPLATAVYYQRMCGSPGRVRLLGTLILTLVGLPLVVTARLSHAEKSDITVWIECYGWLVTAAMIVVIALPGRWHRAASFYWGSRSARLWPISALKVAFGIFLCWVALFVL
jgi:hypothetical protein